MFVAGNHRHFKFGMLIDHSKSQASDDKPFLDICSKNIAIDHSRCCHVAKISILLHEIDAMENDCSVRFWTESRNTIICAHVQRENGQQHKKTILVDKVSCSFRNLGR